MLCSRQDCPHWGKATKYPRKCYYEVQCWRGWLEWADGGQVLPDGRMRIRWRFPRVRCVHT